jgi:hypothetical protein
MANADNISNKTLSGDFGESESITVGTPLSDVERLSTGEISEDVTVAKQGPNTSIDMHNVEKWEVGDSTPKGSFARSIGAFKRYRNDMEVGKSADKNYKHIYVDTLSMGGKKVSEQLEKLKK